MEPEGDVVRHARPCQLGEVVGVEREVRSVRKDLEKQSSQVGARVEKLVAEAQSLIGQ